MKYDLTTDSGRKKALKDLKSWGSIAAGAGAGIATGLSTVGIAGAAGVICPPLGVVAGAAAFGISKLLSQGNSIDEQKEVAESLIKSGKQQGLDTLEIMVDNQAGIDLGTNVAGIPIKTSIGSNGKMALKVKYR